MTGKRLPRRCFDGSAVGIVVHVFCSLIMLVSTELELFGYNLCDSLEAALGDGRRHHD